jgi:hypothetical protein
MGSGGGWHPQSHRALMVTSHEQSCDMKHGCMNQIDMDNGNAQSLLGFRCSVGNCRSTFPPIAPPVLQDFYGG